MKSQSVQAGVLSSGSVQLEKGAIIKLDWALPPELSSSLCFTPEAVLLALKEWL
jgi:hypothetical protein